MKLVDIENKKLMTIVNAAIPLICIILGTCLVLAAAKDDESTAEAGKILLIGGLVWGVVTNAISFLRNSDD